MLGPLWRRFRPAVFAWLDARLVDVRTNLRSEGIDARSRLSDPPTHALAHPRGRPAGHAARDVPKRSLIMQRWMMAVGRPHDVLIEREIAAETTIAHAWLDHEDWRGHHVLTRLPPAGAPRSR